MPVEDTPADAFDELVDDWSGDTAPPGPGRFVASGPIAVGPVDLSTRYLGFTLRSPVVASASPMTGDVSSLRALDAAGVGAVVLPSLFEEQISGEADGLARYLTSSAGAHAEAPEGYVPDLLDGYNDGAVRYLRLVRAAKDAVGVPVIASLNGTSRGGWTHYAAMVAEAGADAVELNVYRVAADAKISGAQIETETLEMVQAVVAAAGVPVAVKLSPFWSSLAHLATRLIDAGASGLVLFNRFYQPDIDLQTLSVSPSLHLSDSHELRLPLRWCAILRGRIHASIAATTGVHTPDDVAKVLLAGADVAMTTSALLRNGPGHAGVLIDGLTSWLEGHGYGSVEEAIGAVSQARVTDPSAFERANYLETITRYAGLFRA
ncbi:MAG: dihydroorotate dehydrogenase-like protein [Nitriliruptoraceae bacterium]